MNTKFIKLSLALMFAGSMNVQAATDQEPIDNFIQAQIDETAFDTFTSALSKLTKLQTLGLEDNDFQNSATILAPAIANMTDLQKLGLACNNLGTMEKAALDTFTSALFKLTKLQLLDLYHNNRGNG